MGNPAELASWNESGNINPCGDPVWYGIGCTSGVVTMFWTQWLWFPEGTWLSPSLSAITTLTSITLRCGPASPAISPLNPKSFNLSSLPPPLPLSVLPGLPFLPNLWGTPLAFHQTLGSLATPRPFPKHTFPPACRPGNFTCPSTVPLLNLRNINLLFDLCPPTHTSSRQQTRPAATQLVTLQQNMSPPLLPP